MAYVANPAVPYVGPIGVLQTGGMVQVSGHVPPHAKWFAINLQCGPGMNPRDDIALHVNPRFEGNLSKVVRNSLQSQQWGVEENFGHFPFSLGQPFEVLILAEPDHFKIAINGQHYTEFRHRLPLGRVNTIAIDGDVQLFTIRYDPPLASASAYGAGASHQPQYGATSPPYLAPAGQYSGGYGYGPPPAGAYAAQPPYGAPSSVPYGGHQPLFPPASTPSTSFGFPGLPSMPVFMPYSLQPPDYLHAMSSPMPVPGSSPAAGRKSPSMLPGIAAGAGAGVLAGAAAYGVSRLMYPHGKHGFGKHHKMKFKHKFHKPKFHKMPKHKGWSHKWHKGWKHGGWGSHSSSSSEESE